MRFRAGAIAVALLLFAGACSSEPPPRPAGPRAGSYGSGVRLPADHPSPATEPRISAETVGAEENLARVDDLDSVGQAARPLLQTGRFTQILVEVDWVAGREPTAKAKEILATRLKEVTHKSVKFAGGNVIDAGGPWTLDDIATLSLGRNTHSVEPALSLYVAFLDGRADENKFGLGRVVASTVIAIFPDVIKNFTPPSVDVADVQAGSLVHELGHLLGLVNLIYDSPRPHGDPSNPQHSKNPKSVMYHAFEQSFGASVFGAPPNQFDPDDLADLADLAAGRL